MENTKKTTYNYTRLTSLNTNIRYALVLRVKKVYNKKTYSMMIDENYYDTSLRMYQDDQDFSIEVFVRWLIDKKDDGYLSDLFLEDIKNRDIKKLIKAMGYKDRL